MQEYILSTTASLTFALYANSSNLINALHASLFWNVICEASWEFKILSHPFSHLFVFISQFFLQKLWSFVVSNIVSEVYYVIFQCHQIQTEELWLTF